MRKFQIANLDCDTFGEFNEGFYDEKLSEAHRLISLYGDNGLVMLNRDLTNMNRRMRRYKGVDDEMYNAMATDVRALHHVIQEVSEW